MAKRYTTYEIYDLLKNRILTCRYQPGELIFEKDIVDELKVSRTPVREALNILNGEGLLKIIPKKGIQIAPLSIKKMKQVYEIRKLLEPLAISQAIRYIKAVDIEYLDKLDKTLGSSVDSENVTNIFKYGMDIHLYIAKLSGNETLFNILKLLREESYRGYVHYLKQYLNSCTEAERKAVEDRIINMHNKIVEAIKAGNEKEAIESIIIDLDTMNQFIIDN